ncbi:competence protein CoiA family protein [Streptomyces sp. CWNU-52B]|uniref:competence protein CoiA family protein n=1 Tax=unclassified Streptomyces TaxID=2593676 RepID=UPI0039C4CA99
MSRPAREVALRDQRLVQTAVIGGAGSQAPALLPMQAAQARAFRQAHVGQTFWCGQWLGGCRGRLTIRTPKQRVAHFVHVAGPERAACRRRLVGVSGADHLYIKQQILAWLDGQGIAAAARLPADLERAGSEVLFDPGERGCLRVLLDAPHRRRRTRTRSCSSAPGWGMTRASSPSTATCCASAATPTARGGAS